MSGSDRTEIPSRSEDKSAQQSIVEEQTAVPTIEVEIPQK
jgi:hypothetical protein